VLRARELLAWAPLLDLGNINHGLLLPIRVHCVDDQGAGLCLVEANILYSTSCTMECFAVASSIISYAS
jgi:hypothetical protein